VSEAKVVLQNYDAEFGKAVGSVVTAQTKSGSNEIHGSGFYFRRTDAAFQAVRSCPWYFQNYIRHQVIPLTRACEWW
jgi:hypothetical protein